jgi:hypothetical protein
MYLIRQYCPRSDIDMGRHGFTIMLHPELQRHVAATDIDDAYVTAVLSRHGREWLDACGFDRWYDPDNAGHLRDPYKSPGPRATPSYQPRDIRVTWGPWGPEHISVPGNACGLDIDRRPLSNPLGTAPALLPHNVDSWAQKQLLTIVFTDLIDRVLVLSRVLQSHG